MNRKYHIEKTLHRLMNESEDLRNVDNCYKRGLLTSDEALSWIAKAIREEKQRELYSQEGDQV